MGPHLAGREDRRTYPTGVQVIVAGVGNVLRGDDGFGVEVARTLLDGPAPPGVRVLELGIGGIHLVQELMGGVDGLVVVDAVDLGRDPGTVLVIRPVVRDVTAMSQQERHDELADMHYATPERAFLLARGLGVLPEATWLVGCQPKETDHLGEGLSPELRAAIGPAAAEVRRVVTSMGLAWN
jgi:hydrogenase maturation protease